MPQAASTHFRVAGPQCGAGEQVRVAADRERRRDGRQGGGAGGPR